MVWNCSIVAVTLLFGVSGKSKAFRNAGKTELSCKIIDADDEWIKICYTEKKIKEIYNGVLDFYVDYGFASSIYDDWFWKIFYEKGSKGNKFSIWISDFDVYEEQRHMGICS